MSSDEKGVKIATPLVGMEGINTAVRALRTYKKPTFYKELATAANVSAIYMSQSLSASRDLGLTTLAGRRGLYQLTNDGEEYARLLSFGKQNESKDSLKNILLSNPLWSEIVRFLRVNKENPRDPIDLVLHIERLIGKSWSSSMRTKLSQKYISILEYAGLITIEEGKLVSQIGPIEEEVAVKEVKEETPRTVISEQVISARAEDFFEFRLPDSFIVYVRKDATAIDFFESQIKEESMLTQWIKFIRNSLGKPKKE